MSNNDRWCGVARKRSFPPISFKASLSNSGMAVSVAGAAVCLRGPDSRMTRNSRETCRLCGRLAGAIAATAMRNLSSFCRARSLWRRQPVSSGARAIHRARMTCAELRLGATLPTMSIARALITLSYYQDRIRRRSNENTRSLSSCRRSEGAILPMNDLIRAHTELLHHAEKHQLWKSREGSV